MASTTAGLRERNDLAKFCRNLRQRGGGSPQGRVSQWMGRTGGRHSAVESENVPSNLSSPDERIGPARRCGSCDASGSAVAQVLRLIPRRRNGRGSSGNRSGSSSGPSSV